jgi:hypothetical protein
LANSTPRFCSWRTKASNWFEANASRKVNCSCRNFIAAFLAEFAATIAAKFGEDEADTH